MNRLAQETSPYLQQHANNPVDWWPWCEEALTAAREQDKPILLSVGYSACHWCHVMAHESFEDTEVATVMNRLFINIKVDREERPDIDQIYQTAHQMLAQRGGGWPLTMFLAPDGAPFFGGTYFPKEQRYGLPGFVGLLERVATAYVEQRESILDQNKGVVRALGRTLPDGHTRPASFDAAPIAAARELLMTSFDPRYGGFGGAPKFPHPTDLALLMRQTVLADDKEAQHAMLLTLRRMAEGGIYDQLGGGFSRYSVDVAWNIPHFEKMLYDNGPLLALNAEAWTLTNDPLFKRVAAETAAWVMREMQSPEGGYYASVDADSEGEEGKYYVWADGEIPMLIGPAEYKLFAAHYGLDRAANFEETHWHLYVAKSLEAVAEEFGLPENEVRMRIDLARLMLFARRETRIRPQRDDKILTSWNALMIAGMARAAAVFGEREWLTSAQRAMDFIQETLWQDGRLLATFKDSKAHLNAYLDDHAYLIEAALMLMQMEFREKDLHFAQQLADALLQDFEDTDTGGFYFTRHDHEQLILRPKPGHDNAIPSGNGVAAFALQRLGHLTGNHEYIAAAERCLALFYADLQSSPGGYSSMLLALAEQLVPPTIIILRGDSPTATEWLGNLHMRCMPDVLAMYLPDNIELPEAMKKPHTAAGDAAASAWVCRGVSCMPPATTFEALTALLPDKAGGNQDEVKRV